MSGAAAPRSTGNGSSGEGQDVRSVINNVVYLDGRPAASPATLADTFELLERQPDSTAWIGLYRPAEAQLMDAAAQLGLHGLAVEDAITAHQRPKLERYGDTLFVVLRSATTATTPSGSASANCTCSSAPTSCSQCGTATHRTWPP